VEDCLQHSSFAKPAQGVEEEATADDIAVDDQGSCAGLGYSCSDTLSDRAHAPDSETATLGGMAVDGLKSLWAGNKSSGKADVGSSERAVADATAMQSGTQ